MTAPKEEMTVSWHAYQACMSRISEFLHEFRLRGSEVWLGDVSFGSPEDPWLRAPLGDESARLVHDSIQRAQHLADAVQGSLTDAVRASKQAMKEMEAKGVDWAELAPLIDRTEFMERLLNELTSVAKSHPMNYHPAVINRWHNILERSLGPGTPAVRVKVVTVYVL